MSFTIPSSYPRLSSHWPLPGAAVTTSSFPNILRKVKFVDKGQAILQNFSLSLCIFVLTFLSSHAHFCSFLSCVLKALAPVGTEADFRRTLLWPGFSREMEFALSRPCRACKRRIANKWVGRYSVVAKNVFLIGYLPCGARKDSPALLWLLWIDANELFVYTLHAITEIQSL